MKKSERISKPDKCRRKSGKFRKGVSGNPAGKPRGCKNKITILRHMFETSKERLISKAIAMALAGDTSALKLCLERLVPVLKPQSGLVEIDIPAQGDTTQAGQAKYIFDSVIAGRLSPDDGQRLIDLLIGQAKVFEMVELKQKVNDLEMIVARQSKEDC